MKILPFLVVLAAVSAPALEASADLVSPDNVACRGRNPGDACTLSEGGEGRCVEFVDERNRTLRECRSASDAALATTATPTASASSAPVPAGPSASPPPASPPAQAGCGCSVPGDAESYGPWILAALPAAALLAFRRRARRDAA